MRTLPRFLVLLLALVAAACSSQPVPTTPLPVASPTSAPPITASPLATPAPTLGPSIPLSPTPTAAPGTPTPVRSLSPDTGLARQLRSQLQAALDEQQLAGGIPGLGAAVILPDGSIWSSGSGEAQLDPARGAMGDTPFVVGSITKTFIAATVMQLADEGRLAIDDPLSNWLPDYPNAAQITLRELLHHTSGIYNYFEYPTYDTLVFQTLVGHIWTPQEILDTLVNEPYFAPGTGYHYSNTNFILLGLVVEQATGQQLGDVLEQRFFTPLGLHDTYFQGNGPPSPDSAVGYLLKPAGFKAVSDATDYRPTISAATVAWAAGGIVSSARDIAAWCDALYGGHVVSPAALAQMEDWTYYPAPDETYGLGTRSRVIGGERVFGHTGSIRGFDAAAWHFPDTNMTIAVMTNLGRIDANPIVDALAAVALPVAQGYLP